MQNKGAITLLAVLIGLVSLYHLSFTWKANNVEKAAKVYANGDSIQERAYLDSVSYFGFNYNEIKELELKKNKIIEKYTNYYLVKAKKEEP